MLRRVLSAVLFAAAFLAVAGPAYACHQPATDGERCVRIATGPVTGNLYLTFQDDEGTKITFRRSLDMGDTWSLEVVLSGPQRARRPTLAVDESERLYVAWYEDTGVFLTESDDRGVTWATPRRISEPAEEKKRTVEIAAHRTPGGDTTLAMVYSGVTIGPNGEPDKRLLSRASLDAGATWSDEVAVAPITSGRSSLQVGPEADHAVFHLALIGLPSSNVFYTNSLDPTNGYGAPVNVSLHREGVVADNLAMAVPDPQSAYIVWAALITKHKHVIRMSATRNGGVSWTHPLNIGDHENSFSFPHVVAEHLGPRTDAVYVVAVRNPGSEVVLRISSNSGRTWSPPLELCSDDARCSKPHLAIGLNRELYLTMSAKSAAGGHIYFRRSLDHGGSWSAPVRVSGD